VSATATPDPNAKPKDELAAPPEARWPTILDNARKKASSETEARVFEDYGIPRTADKARVREFIQALDADPIGLYHRLGKELAPYLTPQTPQPSVSRPLPRLRAEDGTAAYDADAVDAMIGELRAYFTQELHGAIQPIEAERTAAAKAQIWKSAEESAGRMLTEARAEWDGFTDLEPQIAALMEQDGRVTFESAYNRLYQPWRKERDRKSREETRQQVLQEIKKTPAHSPSIVPGSPVRAGAPKRSRSFDADVEAAVSKASQMHGGL